MLTPRERIERQMTDPWLVRLHRKLSALKSTATVMHTGAHPDDEQNGLLAYFRMELGMRIIIACSTRGEGGQNALGPERLGALGVIRSRELEEAARVIDADISWLGHGPADVIHDFGFSKDGDQTFGRWGHERIVERLVRAYRKERPDIVIPTFLDVPGQHGHHRAMTRAARSAIALAADPSAYPEHFSEGLKPWTVAKFYLPAWSGGGDTYDDEVPPPETTLTINAAGREQATGAEYDRIGEWSRYYHASQGMGHWPKRAQELWPLHLELSATANREEGSILDNLPSTLAALAGVAGLDAESQKALVEAEQAITRAIAAFPDTREITRSLLDAAALLQKVDEAAASEFADLHGHRITRKRAEVDAAILTALNLFERAYAEPAEIVPGGETSLYVELSDRAAEFDVKVTPVLPSGVSSSISSLGRTVVFSLAADQSAAVSGLYQPDWKAAGGNGHGFVRVAAKLEGREVSALFDLEEPFFVTPAQSLTLSPDAFLVPLGQGRDTHVFQALVKGADTPLSFRSAGGWNVQKSGDDWIAERTGEGAAGLAQLEAISGSQPAFQITPIAYPHIGRARFLAPSVMKILSLDLKLPRRARIGYVGGGADRVGSWLSRMGLDVTELDAQALGGDLSPFTTIVVGIFAFGIRRDLTAATEKLHRFVENGGHLVTLYHRPTDGWNPETTPVRRLEIGKPSLRWRVTDPKAEVTVLLPDHPLLAGPNVIDAADWAGWDKERGLYFASRWDDVYEPLLAMHDVDEQPLKGALVSGIIGKGRHTHTSLVLHHQMDKLVPGAFRLMANLVQPA
ncbi:MULTISPECIES: PIG-L family deacetylase [Rhizobium/Agrobacterium group]|uniref:PIG-L family deacetylase n=1 Tax=Rhizobium/Agrobacterium group TaxID=227290 RepID=UPI00230195A6|nr:MULTISPECIES: PIG-L family deacetylase [Rhizobium/Agrobacterium group]MDA5635274.1 PIG-L family deacetylase [Agrobacterium sp. ST15.16.024]MDF1890521.1 PIG-L family deacetylase [Rhizobium rhizogenes]